ncbi:COG1470 family protein [Wenjunlia tyrosinilytica]|uniref:DUF916 domain-containing protein n=1 Tax=Wenjunlia tyrosinilytica TaxID=1544741 RepID=A0A917ZRH1_9ACTN|nr:DUF916 domain-containing protein [Wenjunlia tyrosinilytica]GGO88165.1 hypothetical protein GCM10012280_28330 [Wenjunlia tyrosinilytica]
MDRRRTWTVPLALLALVAAALGILVGAGGPARAADNGRWSVFPAPAGHGKASDRQYFYLEGDPGTVLKDKVSVSNLSSEPMTFRIYGADAYNTPRDGGFAVRGEQERQTGVGAWVAPAKDRLTVPPRTRADIPFTVTVPRDATPGDHPGALVALDTEVDKAKGSVAIGVRRAVGARIHLRVGGPALPALAVEDVGVGHGRPLLPGTGESTATLRYTLVNRGNVSLRPHVTLRAQGLFGRTLLQRTASRVPFELLPGQKVRLTERWAGAPRLDHVNVRVTATADRGRLRSGASASFLAVPWLAVGLLLAGLAGAGAWLVLRHRARHTAAGEEEAADTAGERDRGEEGEGEAGAVEAASGSGTA